MFDYVWKSTALKNKQFYMAQMSLFTKPNYFFDLNCNGYCLGSCSSRYIYPNIFHDMVARVQCTCTLVTLKVFGLAFQFLECSTSIRKELLAHSSMHIYICWYWQQTLNYTRRIGLTTMAFNFYLSLISWPIMDILRSI